MGYVGYQTPISQENYINVFLISAILGFFLLAYFFIYQIAYKKNERKLMTEICTAFFASAFLSVGAIFMFLHIGVYL